MDVRKQALEGLGGTCGGLAGVRPTGASNASSGVVDYLAMWIHQRTGKNTAISYGLGPVLLLGFFALGVIATAFQYAWFVLVPALVVWVAWAVVAWVRGRREEQDSCNFHDAEHVDGVWDEGCHWCELENMELDLRERQQAAAEKARTDRERLRTKYQA